MHIVDTAVERYIAICSTYTEISFVRAWTGRGGWPAGLLPLETPISGELAKADGVSLEGSPWSALWMRWQTTRYIRPDTGDSGDEMRSQD